MACGTQNRRKDLVGQYVVWFAGGMLALGGSLLLNDTRVSIGEKIADGCAWTYKNAPHEIMLEVISTRCCPGLSECDWTAGDAGPLSSVGDGRYFLRPEAIASIFYMYRITGDTAYQDTA